MGLYLGCCSRRCASIGAQFQRENVALSKALARCSQSSRALRKCLQVSPPTELSRRYLNRTLLLAGRPLKSCPPSISLQLQDEVRFNSDSLSTSQLTIDSSSPLRPSMSAANRGPSNLGRRKRARDEEDEATSSSPAPGEYNVPLQSLRCAKSSSASFLAAPRTTERK